MQASGTTRPLSDQEQLFLSVVDQLSRPLVQMSRLSELAQAAGDTETESYHQGIQSIGSSTLQLLENYALSLRLKGMLVPAEQSHIAVASLLYDTAHELAGYAKQYDVRIELDTPPRLKPIVGDRRTVQAAMVSLGQVFITAEAERQATGSVRLGAHRSRYGIVTGLYGAPANFGADSLRRAKALRGRAGQPLARLVSGAAAGVFVADALLASLEAHLHVARYHNLTGLATTLPTSLQLQLV